MSTNQTTAMGTSLSRVASPILAAYSGAAPVAATCMGTHSALRTPAFGLRTVDRPVDAKQAAPPRGELR